MAKIRDPIPHIYIYILYVRIYWASILGSFGGPGIIHCKDHRIKKYVYVYICYTLSYACI